MEVVCLTVGAKLIQGVSVALFAWSCHVIVSSFDAFIDIAQKCISITMARPYFDLSSLFDTRMRDN